MPRSYERHGMRHTKAYSIWEGMLSRCCNPNCHAYPDYGGRGIVVCDGWRKFSGFYADMGDPPEGRSLDRIDNDGPYAPENCRWATNAMQSRNRRNQRLITVLGETMPLCDWAERLGLSTATVWARLNKGWSEHAAVTTPRLRESRR